jgi:DNA polymerase-3 subunit alpha
VGQFDLFGGLGGDAGEVAAGFAIEIPDLPEFDRRRKLADEREMLGLYVSDHPLRGVENALARFQDVEIAAIVGGEESMGDRVVRIAGLVSGVQTKVTKQGNPWAIATVEDLSGSIEVLFFPRSYETIQSVLAPDIIVQVEGKVNIRDDQVSVYGQSLTVLNLRDDQDVPLDLELAASRCTTGLLTELRGCLEAFPGASPVRLHLRQPGRTTVVEVDPRLRVSQTSAFFSQVKAIVGVGGVLTQR